MNKIVTRETLQAMLNNNNPQYVAKVIGHALKVLLNNQTRDEQASNETKEDNGIGFTGADARGGSITAKYYIKHGDLQDWQIDHWTRLASNGYSRLTKYHKQLNDAAAAKAKADAEFNAPIMFNEEEHLAALTGYARRIL